MSLTLCKKAPSSKSRPQACQTSALFSVLVVPGFSTASYLKVHIKTHHGTPLPHSTTMHTFPEPRGELQMHNGNPYHMGRQCIVEGKQPPAPSQTLNVYGFDLLCCFVKKHAAASLCMFVNTSIRQLLLPSFSLKRAFMQLHALVIYLRMNVLLSFTQRGAVFTKFFGSKALQEKSSCGSDCSESSELLGR